jgi:hypothetical protein
VQSGASLPSRSLNIWPLRVEKDVSADAHICVAMWRRILCGYVASDFIIQDTMDRKKGGFEGSTRFPFHVVHFHHGLFRSEVATTSPVLRRPAKRKIIADNHLYPQ